MGPTHQPPLTSARLTRPSHTLRTIAYIALLLPALSFADSPGLTTGAQDGSVGWRVELKQWVSDGSTRTSHDASAVAPIFGDPTSRLRFRKVRSNITELSARFEVEHTRNWLQLTGGSGSVRSGTLQDDDFVSALGATAFGTSVAGAHRFSSTDSDLSGDHIKYVDITVGRRVLEAADGTGSASLFGSYQEWRERYVATGVVQNVCTAPGTLCAPVGSAGFFDRAVITDRVRWRSLYVGVEGERQMSDRLHATARFAYAPRARLQNDDTHHLRTDLRQDPSFSQRGDGDAVQLEVDFRMHLIEGLAAHLGLRYWRAKVGSVPNGFRAHPASGPQRIEADLNEFRTERKGLLLGVSYTPGMRHAR